MEEKFSAAEAPHAWPVPSTNGHGAPRPVAVPDSEDLAAAMEPTEEDIASQFPVIVEEALKNPDGKEEQHWITVDDQSFLWAGTHYEAVSTPTLERMVVRLSKTVTSTKNVGTAKEPDFVEYHPFIRPRHVNEALQWFRRAPLAPRRS